MNNLFVVVCKYFDSLPFIFNCVESIRKHHKDDILVIDSNSNDKQYLQVIKKAYTNIETLNAKNVNYVTGAVWATFANFNYENYYFLHDSIKCLGSLRGFDKYDATAVLTKRISEVPLCWHWAPVGGIRSPYWAIQKLKGTGVKFRDNDFNVIIGPMFGVKRRVLEHLKYLNFDKILPSCKVEMEMMERVWGMAFRDLDIQFENNVILRGRSGAEKPISLPLKNLKNQTIVNVDTRVASKRPDDKIQKYWILRK